MAHGDLEYSKARSTPPWPRLRLQLHPLVPRFSTLIPHDDRECLHVCMVLEHSCGDISGKKLTSRLR